MQAHIDQDEQLKQLFQYYVHDVGANQSLFLLHGTGGSETDLQPLVSPFLSNHNIVGLLGNVRENGLARFFTRFADGSFDKQNIQTEANKLHKFLSRWLILHQHESSRHVFRFVGYSNGANMILAYLFLYPQMVETAVLLHPMLPFQPAEGLRLSQKKLFVSWGTADPKVPAQSSQLLIKTLETRGATLVIHQSRDHAIESAEVQALQRFLQSTGG